MNINPDHGRKEIRVVPGQIIENEWNGYVANVYPKGFVNSQHEIEVKRAFFGAHAVLMGFMLNILPAVPEKVGETLIESISQELKDFAKDQLNK